MDIFLEVLAVSAAQDLSQKYSGDRYYFFSCLRAFGLDQKHQSLDSSKRPFGDFCLFSGCGAV